jgi:hypothetical protein
VSARDVKEWFQMIQTMDDKKLAQHLLGDLRAYRNHSQWEGQDIEQVLAIFTAIRLDQMTKENS